MKFEVLQEELVKGLGIVSRAVAARAQLPALSNILVEVKNTGITLSATDLEIGINTKIMGKVIEEGAVLAPAKMISDFVLTLPSGKVEILLEKESLRISSGNYKAKFQTLPTEEFPKVAFEGKAEGLFLKTKELVGAVNSVSFASAKDSLRPILTGILFETTSGGLKLVATDGFRLAINKLKTQGKGEKASYLIPARTAMEVAKIAQGEEIRLIPLSETQVVFQTSETTLTSQLLDGNFPEYQKIIPKEFSTKVEIAREELLAAVRTLNIFARDNSNMTRWSVAGGMIRMKSESPERGEASAIVAAKIEGEGGEIVFNARFVLDYLQSSQAETIEFSMIDSLKPGILREKGNEDYLYIVMPINA